MRSYQQIKQTNHKQIRRDYLQEKFKIIRHNLEAENKVADEEMFVKLLATTEKTNYQQNKGLLKFYSYRDQNSFRLLGLVGLVYQYLIDVNIWDQDSIQILRNCSQYQQIQIPQTKQFTNMLIEWLTSKNLESNKKKKTDEGLTYFQDVAIDIILLLMRCHQYTPILRNSLFQMGLLKQLNTLLDIQIFLKNTMQEESEIKLKEQTEIEFKVVNHQNTIQQNKFTFNQQQHNVTSIIICDICCCAFTQMPLLQDTLLQDLLKFIGKIVQNFPESVFIVCDAIFSKVNSTCKPSYNLGRMILNNLHSLIIDRYYFQNIDHCLDFFNYTTRSSVELFDQSKQKLLSTISSNEKTNLKRKALSILRQSLEPVQQQKNKFDLSELFPTSFLGSNIQKISSLEISKKKQFINANHKYYSQEKNMKKIVEICIKNIEFRKQCLEVFGLLVNFSDDCVESIINQDFIHTEEFIFMIKDCLKSGDNSLIIQALTILNTLLTAQQNSMSDQSIKTTLLFLTEQSLIADIEHLQLTNQNQQIVQQCQLLINMLQNNRNQNSAEN